MFFGFILLWDSAQSAEMCLPPYLIPMLGDVIGCGSEEVALAKVLLGVDLYGQERLE